MLFALQAVARGFLQRRRTHHFRLAAHAAALLVQRLFRGHRVRQWFRVERLRLLNCIRRIQRCWRAHVRYLLEVAMAKLIQRGWKRYRSRVFLQMLFEARRRRMAATNIQVPF